MNSARLLQGVERLAEALVLNGEGVAELGAREHAVLIEQG